MLRLNIKEQNFYTHVMHIDGKKLLVTIIEPLNLTLQSYLENETRTNLRFALQGQLRMLRSRGFIPVICNLIVEYLAKDKIEHHVSQHYVLHHVE
jgi:hypothetical protein